MYFNILEQKFYFCPLVLVKVQICTQICRKLNKAFLDLANFQAHYNNRNQSKEFTMCSPQNSILHQSMKKMMKFYHSDGFRSTYFPLGVVLSNNSQGLGIHTILQSEIYIQCSKKFKCNLYFYVSGQSEPFWAVLKLLSNSNMKSKQVNTYTIQCMLQGLSLKS